jgi:hypothetical protein
VVFKDYQMTINFTKALASNQAAEVTAYQKASGQDGEVFKAVVVSSALGE